MSRKNKSGKTSSSSVPESPTFEQDYLDIDHWPHRWKVKPRDLLPGERMLDIFKLFLEHMLTGKRSRKTLLLYRDHLCDLGAEIIRLLHVHRPLRKQPIDRVLRALLHQDGGPSLYPCSMETEQRAFDATCKKLHRFLLDSNIRRNK